MLIFAKDISNRDHKHARETEDPELKAYMEYQRKLFPYTVVRAGLDLAYKELDDILQYVDHDHQPPPDASRQDYPADIPEWYRMRFPWTSAFLKMEDTHFVLVTLVKAMDSFRTEETPNTFQLAVLYDSVHNIVEIYNGLLKESQDRARDIHLSQSVAVNFDDFVNNYWPHLDFMILSKPDFPHAFHMQRNRKIEDDIKEMMADGVEPLTALDTAAEKFDLDPTTLTLLRRDPVKVTHLDLASQLQKETTYQGLYKETEAAQGEEKLSAIDAAYQKSFELAKEAGMPIGESVKT